MSKPRPFPSLTSSSLVYFAPAVCIRWSLHGRHYCIFFLYTPQVPIPPHLLPSSMADPSTTPDVTSRISLASTRSPDVMSAFRASPEMKKEDKRDWGLSPSRVLLQSQQKPSRAEELGWYLYGLCSYFIQTTLVPIIFPLIVAQIATKNVDKFEPVQGWDRSFKGLSCFGEKEMKLWVDHWSFLFYFFC